MIKQVKDEIDVERKSFLDKEGKFLKQFIDTEKEYLMLKKQALI